MLKKFRVLLSVFVYFLVFYSAKSQQVVLDGQFKIGSQCPDFNIYTFENGTANQHKLNEFKGKVVILEFWATFCGPCIPALEHFEGLESRHKDVLKVFAITNEDMFTVQNFLNSHPTKVQIGIDINDELNNLFYHQFIPHTVIIDPNGKLVAITSPEQVDDLTIENIVNGYPVELKIKPELEEINSNTDFKTINQTDNAIYYKMDVGPRRVDSKKIQEKVSNREFKFINSTIPEIYSFYINDLGGNNADKNCVRMAKGFEEFQNSENSICLNFVAPIGLTVPPAQYGISQLESVFALNSSFEFYTLTKHELVLNDTKTIKEMEGGSYMTLGSLCKFLKQYNYVDYEVLNGTGLDDNYQVKLILPNNRDEIFASLQTIGFEIRESQYEQNCILLSKGF